MDPSQGWKGRDKPNQGMGAETRAMIGNPNARGSDQTIRPPEPELPESIGFEEAEMTPEMTPAEPVPQAGESVPAELAPPSEMTASDSFFDLRPAGAEEPPSTSPGQAADSQPSADVTDSGSSVTELGAPVSEGLPPVSNEMDSDALMAHNAALTEEIHALRNQLQNMSQNAGQAGAASGALSAEVQSLRSQLLQAQQQAANARDRAQQLEEQLAGSAPAAEISRLTAQFEVEARARREAEEDQRLAREEIAHTRAEQGALMAEIETLRAAARTAADTAAKAGAAELEQALQQAARLSAALDEANGAVANMQRANDELVRQASAQAAQLQASANAVQGLAAQVKAGDADIARLNAELAQAVAAAAPVAAPAGPEGKRGKGNADLEAQIKTLKKEVAQKEKEVKETREALDSEAARSFRLSQRRIPTLQNELADAHAQGMEMRRKMEKLEAEKRVVVENIENAQRQVEELERALAAAKARAPETTVAAPPEAQTSAADDEVKRLGVRLKAAEEERRKLSESLQQIDKGKRGEIEKYEERLARTQVESNERHESYLTLRKQIKLLAGRLGQTVKLAAMLAAATSEAQRKMLIDGIEKLGKESEAVGSGHAIELATLAPPVSAPVADSPSTSPVQQAPASQASQAPAVSDREKKESSQTEIVRAPEVSAPSTAPGQALPQEPSPQGLGAPEDLIEPSAEPMSLDGQAPDIGLDGMPDDIGGPTDNL